MKKIRKPLFAMVVSGIVASFLLITAHDAHGQHTHLVKTGETLSQIAYAYGVPIKTLADSNHITNRNMIYAGQLLDIPVVYERTVSGTVGQFLPEQYQPVNPMFIYTVKMGESLSAIAAKFQNVTLQDILAANNIFPAESNYIKAGHRLAIPFQEFQEQ